MNRKKNMAKNTVVLTFGKICTQGISFLMLPLYTSILDTAEYGTFDLLVTYATLLLPLVNWQLDQGIFRYMLDIRRKFDKQKILFSTVILFSGVQSIVFGLLFFFITPFLTIEHSYFLLCYVVLCVFQAIMLQFVRGLGEIKKYAIASFISVSFTVLFNIVTLVTLEMGLSGLFVSTIMAQIFTLMYLILSTKCWRYFSIRAVSKTLLKDVCKYSTPLIPNNLAWWVVNSSDRLVISHFIGIAANGLFTVASKFPNAFITFYNVVNLSWTETVSLHFNDDDRDNFLSEMMTTMYGLFSASCFGVVTIMPFIYPVLVNIRYADSYNQVLILMYAMLFRVLVGMYSCIYIATKQSKKVAITSISAAAINLVFDFILVGKIGLYAASISSLIAFLIMFIIRYYDVNRTIKMKIKKSIAMISIIVGLVIPFTYYSKKFILQLIAIILVILYSVYANYTFLNDLKKLIIRRLHKK